MRRNAIVLVALLFTLAMPVHAIAADASNATTAAATPMMRLTRLAPRVPAGAAPLGGLRSDQPLAITVVLQPTHTDRLSALLDELSDPTSPRYQQWLSPAEFLREFGPSPARIDAVTAWLHAQGLNDTSVEGMAVHATADVERVSHALGVSFSRYRLATGATGYIASAAPLVPRTLADAITTVVGLSETNRLHSDLDLTPRGRMGSARSAAAPMTPYAVSRAVPRACVAARDLAGDTSWTSDQLGRFYRVDELFAAGLTGKGKTIALLEFGQSHASDTNQYLSCFGLHNTVKVNRVDGGGNSDPFYRLEAELDIQEAATQAPDATIVSYETPNTHQGEYDALSRVISDNQAQVVSASWGTCEAVYQAEAGGPAFVDALHALFQQSAAQGQSVFAASGDNGSEDCYNGTRVSPSETLQVGSPADDPYVTGVGGTVLENGGVEPVWNDCEGTTGDNCAANGFGASGGGQSTHFTRPRWQVLASNATCTTCREVPDISANAGAATFYANGSWTVVGGTSVASPLLAGIAADIAEGCAGQRLGNFGSRLSALAALHVYGSALNDITTGVNWSNPSNLTLETPGTNDLTRTHAGAYKTTTGFDLATGLGTPIATGLACPQINSMSPNHGTAGTRVTLHGVGLERAKIKFGSAAAKVLSSGARTAVVIAPAGTGRVRVSGSDPMGTGGRAASFSYPGSDTGSYRTVAADGRIFNFGDARGYGKPDPASLHAPIVGMAVDHATGGYWLVASDGNVYSFNAPFYGSAGNHPLNQPIVGIAATKRGDGYWLVARDGGIFAFGKAKFWGSTGGMQLNRPIVGIAVAPATGGYWLVASDGGIFAFNAPFYGSTGGLPLNQPIVGIAANNTTGGYWLVASDGGVFAFKAPFYGSTGGIHLNQSIVGIAASDDARGYRFVASDGGVFNFGDARFSGSTGGIKLDKPVVAIAPAH